MLTAELSQAARSSRLCRLVYGLQNNMKFPQDNKGSLSSQDVIEYLHMVKRGSKGRRQVLGNLL